MYKHLSLLYYLHCKQENLHDNLTILISERSRKEISFPSQAPRPTGRHVSGQDVLGFFLQYMFGLSCLQWLEQRSNRRSSVVFELQLWVGK